MTRELIKRTSVELDGKTYELKLDFTAAKDFEDASGKNVYTFLKPIYKIIAKYAEAEGEMSMIRAGLMVASDLIEQETITVTDMQALLWALSGGRDSKDFTPEYDRKDPEAERAAIEEGMRKAGRLISYNVAEVIGKMIEASGSSMEQVEETDEPAEGADPNPSSPAG